MSELKVCKIRRTVTGEGGMQILLVLQWPIASHVHILNIKLMK